MTEKEEIIATLEREKEINLRHINQLSGRNINIDRHIAWLNGR